MTIQRRNWPNIFTRCHSMTLTEIAKDQGVSKAAVCKAAKLHGRTYKKGPYKQSGRDWAKIFKEYGHLSFAEIAKIAGVSKNHIYAIRDEYL